MDNTERDAFIELVKAESPHIRKLCSTAFRLGHEDGWWLNRTDPDTTVSPVDHAAAIDPFKEDEKEKENHEEILG